MRPATGSWSRSTSRAVTASCATHGLSVAVRDHAGPRARHRRLAVRLHEALRPGARRAGRVPAGPAGAVRPDQGARRSARRAVPVPLRRAAHRLAGRRVRRDPRRTARVAVLRPRADRPDERSRRAVTAAHARASASTSCPSAARWRARHGVEVIDPDRARRPRRARCATCTDGRGPDCGHRRGRHGGARLARRVELAQTARRPAARTASPRR